MFSGTNPLRSPAFCSLQASLHNSVWPSYPPSGIRPTLPDARTYTTPFLQTTYPILSRTPSGSQESLNTRFRKEPGILSGFHLPGVSSRVRTRTFSSADCSAAVHAATLLLWGFKHKAGNKRVSHGLTGPVIPSLFPYPVQPSNQHFIMYSISFQNHFLLYLSNSHHILLLLPCH